MARWTNRLITVKFKDAAGSPDEITVGPGPGDLSIGETNAENVEHIRVLNRGQFDGFVQGDDLEQDVSITIELENQSFTDASADRIRDWVMKSGSFNAATSVDSTIWAFKMEITATDGTNTATMTLPYVQGSVDFKEGKEAVTMTFSGTNNGAITVT